MDRLETISPLDGRYKESVEELANIFSEKALMQYRIILECEYLIKLSEHHQITLRNFSDEEKSMLRNLQCISLNDAHSIKDIEVKGNENTKKTNHDVKAIEYYLRYKLKDTTLNNSLEWLHFALTSEDINNISYGLILSDGLEKVIIPNIDLINQILEKLSLEHKDVPMLARTHGQPASPTTFGKEFKVFSSRLERQVNQLKNFEIFVKLNGATGNYNAHHVSYPNISWLDFTRDFIEYFNVERRIKLKPNFITTQIEPHDTYAELFDLMKRINTILIDFNQDIWRYISDDWIKQKVVEEVGSSTMPHKINPKDFENSEGNLELANALFEFFSRKLPISRLQRDLSDSTIERNFGVAFAHSLVGYKSTLKGLNQIEINEEKVLKVLEDHPEVIAEAIQTILRRESFKMSYEKLKELTRGRKITINELISFIEGLDIPEEVKGEIKKIKSSNYTGLASYLASI